MISKKFDPDLEELIRLHVDDDEDKEKKLEIVRNFNPQEKKKFIEYLLYGKKSWKFLPYYIAIHLTIMGIIQIEIKDILFKQIC